MIEKVSVSWVSFNNDPYRRERDGSYSDVNGTREAGPTLEFLFNPDSPVCGQIKKHYLLVRRPNVPEPQRRQVHGSEVAVAKELVREIKQRGSLGVEILYWDTDAAPTDHQALFHFTAPTLAEIRRAHPTAQIVVNLSPGPPAAQTATLLALQARIVGDNVRVYQGTPPEKRKSPKDVLTEVSWNLLAELVRDDQQEGIGDEWSIANARSESLRRVARLVQRYGSVPFPVLIVGNRGSGKTHIADSLRRKYLEWKLKPQTDWQYQLNCAEFRGDPTILRSSLFGYAKGSHSTANDDSPGLLEQAAGDCVFLDEIHWMDFQAQGALLLALQRNGTFRPIGGKKAIKADFRLIAATNKSRSELREALAPDFLDRVSELVIELPDLRDCREDLEDIWKSVVVRACQELVERSPERAVKRDSNASLISDYIEQFRPHQPHIARTLRTLRLEGNYRDLERLARRLLVAGLQTGRLLSVSRDLVNAELEILNNEEQTVIERSSGSSTSLEDELPTIGRCASYLRDVQDKGQILQGPHLVAEWERRLLVAAQKVSTSGTKAAELLSMNPRTFNAKMKEIERQ